MIDTLLLIRSDNNTFGWCVAGSGSTIVGVGSDEPPAFLQEAEYKDLFVSPARLIARESSEWYHPSNALAAIA